MSATVQEIFNNCGSTSHPELDRLTQLTFTGDSSPIWNGSVTIGDSGVGNFTHYSASVFNFSFASTGSLNHVVFGAGSKRVITYNLDKKLLVVADVTDDRSSTYPAYKCYPRIGLIKSATNWMFKGKTSRDRYMTNERCASQYGTIFGSFNYGDPITLGNDSRKSMNSNISLYQNFLIAFDSTHETSFETTGSYIRVGDGIYLADGDIAGPLEDVGRIISDGTKAYICCGYRLWMEYEGGAA